MPEIVVVGNVVLETDVTEIKVEQVLSSFSTFLDKNDEYDVDNLDPYSHTILYLPSNDIPVISSEDSYQPYEDDFDLRNNGDLIDYFIVAGLHPRTLPIRLHVRKYVRAEYVRDRLSALSTNR